MLIAPAMQIGSILEQFMHQMVIVLVIADVRQTVVIRLRHSSTGEYSLESFRYGDDVVEVVRVAQNVVPFVHVDEAKFVVHNLQKTKRNRQNWHTSGCVGGRTRHIPQTGTFVRWSSISSGRPHHRLSSLQSFRFRQCALARPATV